MKYIDLFAGIGGFRLGIEKAYGDKELRTQNRQKSSLRGQCDSSLASKPLQRQRATCVYTNEWDKYAAQIYKKHFGEIDTRDITTIPISDIPDHDLLCGGFPCQSFSVAGKRRGFDDTRGTLFFEIARILAGKRPRYLLLENVKGLLSHDSGKTFQTILRILTNLGYELQWQVLNSKDFGVPQNRERVFIIGHLRGTSRPKVFPITTVDREIDGKSGRQTKLSGALTARYHKMGNADTYLVHNIYGGFGENKPREFRDYSPTIRTPKGGGHLPMVAQRHPLKFLERNQKNIEGDYAFTVDGANTGGVKQGMKIRRLTPTECERLQGFPNGWTEGVSDTQRYKCLGNAVTVNVVQAIAERLLNER